MLKNTNSSYGVISILNHWICAIFFIASLGMGLYMELLPRSPQKEEFLYGHQALAFIVLVLMSIRILWKILTPTPKIIRSFSLWEMYLAKMVHSLLFWSLLVMPLSGWFILNASNQDVLLFQYYTLPRIIEPSDFVAWCSILVHQYLGQILLFILLLHVMGALKHHFVDRDHTLKRMLRPEKFWFNRYS